MKPLFNQFNAQTQLQLLNTRCCNAFTIAQLRNGKINSGHGFRTECVLLPHDMALQIKSNIVVYIGSTKALKALASGNQFQVLNDGVYEIDVGFESVSVSNTKAHSMVHSTFGYMENTVVQDIVGMWTLMFFPLGT